MTGYFIDKDGNYYEGDNKGGDKEVSQRLTPTSKWNGKNWVETGIFFKDVLVKSKAEVDIITAQRIADLGEEKAKTEKILAGLGDCPVWDDFVKTRAVIIKQGDDFITANKLT